jgi:hypothetical protein
MKNALAGRTFIIVASLITLRTNFSWKLYRRPEKPEERETIGSSKTSRRRFQIKSKNSILP